MSLYTFTKKPVATARLYEEIITAVPPPPVCVSVIDNGNPTDNLEVTFADALTSEQETAVEGIVDAHVAFVGAKFIAPSTLVQEAKAFTSTEWTDVGGVVTTLGGFTSDPSRVCGRFVGEFKSDGDFELRLIAKDGTVMTSAAVTLGDTSGAWAFFSGGTDIAPPTLATDRYTLQARRVSGTSAEIRYASLSLLLKTN